VKAALEVILLPQPVTSSPEQNYIKAKTLFFRPLRERKDRSMKGYTSNAA
jgi:hypothetical protein